MILGGARHWTRHADGTIHHFFGVWRANFVLDILRLHLNGPSRFREGRINGCDGIASLS
jgi:hypothetical protein